MSAAPTEVVVIRPMAAADIEPVVHLERAVFGHGWTVQAYLTELTNPSAVYLVASVEGQVVGFCGYHQIMDEAHITTIAVALAQRGRRIGERLVCAMLLIARERGSVRATLEVRQSNRAAQNLYAKYGFVHAAIRKAYYADTGEDADILWIYDMTHAQWRKRFSELRAELGM